MQKRSFPIKKTYRPGEIIPRENTTGGRTHIIESGKLEVSKNIGRWRVVFTTLARGSIFGRMSPMDNSPSPATASANEDTAVTVTGKAGFQAMLKPHQPLRSIYDVLADRLRKTGRQVNPLKPTSYYCSLCSLAFYLTRSLGNRQAERITVELDCLPKESCTILAIQN